MSKKRYTLEFKQGAVKLVTEQGYSQAEAGESLGVNPVNISHWIKELSNNAEGVKEKKIVRVEQEELLQLRKEVKRLKLEREILKKGSGLLCQRASVKYVFIEAQKKAYPVCLLCESSYGSRQMSKNLQRRGYAVGRYQVRGLMRKAGVECKQQRRYKVTTDSSHKLPVAENVLNRKFTVTAPNRVWVADIMYLWTQEG